MVRKQRAFTILEALLVMALVGSLLTLVAMYFSRARHYTSDTETYSHVQSEANLALRRLTDAFYKGTVEWDQYYGDSVIFLSSERLTPSEPELEFDTATGKIVWKKWVCFYYDAANQSIIRAEQPLDSPTSNLLTQPAPAVSPDYFRTEPSLKRKPIAQDVTSFIISGTGVSYDVTVTCQAKSPVPRKSEDDKIIEVSVSTEVFLLN